MPKILQIIPSSSFELIRDRITEILIEEINNQDSLILINADKLNTSIFSERGKSFDKEEMPAINVTLSGGNYDDKNARNADGKYRYNIDVYASSTEEDGDYKSNLKLQKLMGWCRAILENPVYRTLGFLPGKVVNRVNVTGFEIADPSRTDAENISFSRVVLEVLANENVELGTALLIDGYTTKIQINGSNRGYQYKGGNE